MDSTVVGGEQVKKKRRSCKRCNGGRKIEWRPVEGHLYLVKFVNGVSDQDSDDDSDNYWIR